MRLGYYIVLLLLSLVLTNCVPQDDFKNTRRGNFEACWTLLDQYYCYFDTKKIDWNEVYERYSNRIKSSMSDEELFYLLGEMIVELKDGHVNLSSSFDVVRYWNFFLDHPANFDYDVISKYYLGNDFRIAGGLRYKMLPSNIGYIYYSSFSSGVSESNLDQVLAYFSSCHGVIFDVRNNSGGVLTTAYSIASRFTNEEIEAGKICHKIGPAHNAFSEWSTIFITPSERIRYQKPVVVLINRTSYSATNMFASIMKSLPKVTLIGDSTGGGGGLPASRTLPNGWNLRFSSSPMLDKEGNSTELGIAPDIFVNTSSLNQDDIIEYAIHCIKQ